MILEGVEIAGTSRKALEVECEGGSNEKCLKHLLNGH